jgi:hypothetical protein
MFGEAQMQAFKEHVEDQGVRPCAGEGTVRTGRFSGRTCEQAWPILLREKGLAATEKWCRTMGCRWQNLNMSGIKQLTEQHEETPTPPPPPLPVYGTVERKNEEIHGNGHSHSQNVSTAQLDEQSGEPTVERETKETQMNERSHSQSVSISQMYGLDLGSDAATQLGEQSGEPTAERESEETHTKVHSHSQNLSTTQVDGRPSAFRGAQIWGFGLVVSAYMWHGLAIATIRRIGHFLAPIRLARAVLVAAARLFK